MLAVIVERRRTARLGRSSVFLRFSFGARVRISEPRRVPRVIESRDGGYVRFNAQRTTCRKRRPNRRRHIVRVTRRNCAAASSAKSSRLQRFGECTAVLFRRRSGSGVPRTAYGVWTVPKPNVTDVCSRFVFTRQADGVRGIHDNVLYHRYRQYTDEDPKVRKINAI